MFTVLNAVLSLFFVAVVIAMIYMGFSYWYSRNANSKLAVMLREKLFFLPKGFWPVPLGADGPTLDEVIERQEEELDPENQLLKAEKGHIFDYNFTSQMVEGRVATGRMEQEIQRDGEPWDEVDGHDYQLIFVDGNQLFAYYPFGERGRPVWFILEPKDASSLWEFFKGTKENRGPAQVFGRSRQTADVRFNLFEAEWQMKDIGMNSFHLKSGKCDYFSGSGRFAHLVAAEVGGDRVLFFTHIEEGVGYDSVWIGEKADLDFLGSL